MKFGMTWIVEGRILYVVMAGDENKEKMMHSIKVLVNQLDIAGREPYTHIIFDTTELNVQVSVLQVKKLSDPLFGHPLIGWALQVNNNVSPIFQMLANAITLIGVRVRTVKTSGETLKFLQDVDATLPDLSTIELSPPEMREMLDWAVEK